MTHSGSADSELRAAARHLGRRRFLTVTGAATALAFGTNLPDTSRAAAAAREPRFTREPFTLGVGSGDPLPDSVVLWTRLAPQPFEPDSGMPARPVPVHWELAYDADFRRIAHRGTVVAHPEYHHAVHAEPRGLEAGTDYWFRFRAGRHLSPVGRTRTAPAAGSAPGAVRFALASCQRYDQGYYTAYRHLAAEPDLDAVLHLGDYLYEYAVDAAAGARGYTGEARLPGLFRRETVTLEDYRLRYSLYKGDEDLQAAHAAAPWIVTWDDHETENNYADALPENGVPPEEFLLRRAAAYRAYWENMPLRRPQRPEGPDLALYRRLHYGRLAQIDVLDTRQYRDDQVNGDGWKPPTPESEDPARQLLGATQERWLTEGWHASDAVWNVLAQQVVFSRRRSRVESPSPLSMDAWDGYPAARERVLRAADAAGIENLAVLTGDVHVHYGLDIKRDADDPASRTAGVEVVTSSVSSGGDGRERPGNWDRLTAANPHLRLYDGRRGYVVLTLDERRLRADYRTVPHVTTPGAPVTTAASLVSAAGEPGLRPA
ncbi:MULTISPECIES: alkaline phosphatase D family protein [unclassified Streptomyces]|uniref:alkaline phosphatase D family protein n=1 Tax=unclassified Streptomyces TaxID=2593676 RepID=UPI0022B60B02|nr:MULTISPECIES: alkaline phosphatase D family protein [unclassified Streptomyces]MCZ7414011.1 alkaline phosphatase D family protein [Streptomyces sp. WMMC897]MCZ7431006.1 alkaline phosphatase D family protein [Streptomyces sp. WMMC1477]